MMGENGRLGDWERIGMGVGNAIQRSDIESDRDKLVDVDVKASWM